MTMPSEVRIPIQGRTAHDLINEIADTLGYTGAVVDGELRLTLGRPPVGVVPIEPLTITVQDGRPPPERSLAVMIAELRRLDAEATPAPWRWDAGDEVIAGPPTIDTDAESPATAFGKRSVIIETDSGYYGPHGADREIIPAMRNALPAILAELEHRTLLDAARMQAQKPAASAMLAALDGLRECVVNRATVEGDLPWTTDVVRAMERARDAIDGAREAGIKPEVA